MAVNARACGPRLGGDTQKVIRAVKAGEWSRRPTSGTVTAAGIALLPGEFTEKLVAADPDVHHGAARAPPASSCSTPRSPRSSPPRAPPAMSCAWCSRPAATPASTCPTGSRSPSTARPPCWTRSRAHEAFVAGEVLAVSVAYAPVAEPTLRGTVAAPDGPSAEIAALVART